MKIANSGNKSSENILLEGLFYYQNKCEVLGRFKNKTLGETNEILIKWGPVGFCLDLIMQQCKGKREVWRPHISTGLIKEYYFHRSRAH